MAAVAVLPFISHVGKGVVLSPFREKWCDFEKNLIWFILNALQLYFCVVNVLTLCL